MSLVTVSVNQTEVENDNGYPVASVEAECSRCGHRAQSFGTSDRSVKRCLVLLREECPKHESNFYREALS